jgi:ATP-binding cassette, subfamily C (CFTR/MRP), member 1
MCAQAVMKVSDRRVKLVNEVLQGIRVVKYYNWEESFEKRLEEIRKVRVFFFCTHMHR